MGVGHSAINIQNISESPTSTLSTCLFYIQMTFTYIYKFLEPKRSWKLV